MGCWINSAKSWPAWSMNQGGKCCHKCGSDQQLKQDCPQSGNSNRGGTPVVTVTDQIREEVIRILILLPLIQVIWVASRLANRQHRWDRSFEAGITCSWFTKCVLWRRTSAGQQDNSDPGRWMGGGAKHYTDEHHGKSGNSTGGNAQANLEQVVLVLEEMEEEARVKGMFQMRFRLSTTSQSSATQ